MKIWSIVNISIANLVYLLLKICQKRRCFAGPVSRDSILSLSIYILYGEWCEDYNSDQNDSGWPLYQFMTGVPEIHTVNFLKKIMDQSPIELS